MNYPRLIDYVSVTLLGILLVALPLVTASGTGTGAFARQEPLFWTLIVCCALLAGKALSLILVRSGRSDDTDGASQAVATARLTIADLLAATYLIAGAINIAVVRGFDVDPVLFWRWGAVGAIYLTVSITNRVLNFPELDSGQERITRALILNALVLAGSVQAVVAVGQQAGYVASNHRMFDVTGTFGNPGQLGGFLAVAFVVALGLLRFDWRRAGLRWLYLAAAAVIGAGMMLADSRASLAGAAIGVAVLFGDKLAAPAAKRAKTLLPIVPALFIAAGVLAFNHRPASAGARLLVWRVTAELALQKPVAGHGAGSFNDLYMTAQANYFAEHPDSPFAPVADNAAYPYNEFLHLFVEQGIVGVAIFVALLWTVFAFRPRDMRQRTVLGALAALLLFSCFSYPTSLFALLMLFPVLLGMAQSRELTSFPLPKWALVAAVALMAAVIVQGIREIRFYREAGRATMQLFSKESTTAHDFIDRNYDRLKRNAAFYGRYAAWLGEKIARGEESDAELARMAALPPTCENWCDLGDACARRGDYAEAERRYTAAANMIPTRLRPNYLLWKMYVGQGDTVRAVVMAQKVLNMPLKV